MLTGYNSNSEENRFDFDDETKSQIKRLWQERVQGRFKNDREGFTRAFLELKDNAKFDESKPLQRSSLFNGQSDTTEQVLREINEDREQMTFELAEQISARVKEHLYMKQRKASDFVKPRRSEVGVFGE